jgi:hypothetical protein
MCKLRFSATFLVLILSLLGATTVHALDPAPTPALLPSVYVRSDYAGNEEGTSDYPYNTEEEAKAYAQSLPSGADLYVWDGGRYVKQEYVWPAQPGGGGAPLAQPLFWASLLLLAVLLLGTGIVLRLRLGRGNLPK